MTRNWKPGDYAAISVEHAQQHGLPEQFVDVVAVEPDRLLVHADGKKVWVPREIAGSPEDYGMIDDTNHFAIRAADDAFCDLVHFDLERRGANKEEERYVAMARHVHNWIVSLAASEVRAIELGIAEPDREEHRRVIKALHAVIEAELARERGEAG